MSTQPDADMRKVHAVPAKKGKETRVAMLKDNEIPLDRTIPTKEADFRDF